MRPGQSRISRRALPARQTRSQTTLVRLLAAAEACLEAEGLSGATVPRIAERAGLSVGVVYRRFPDKEALLRAVFESFFSDAATRNRESLAASNWEGCGVGDVVTGLIAGMVAGYRSRRGLLSALLLYVETNPDTRFRRRARELMAAASADITQLLMAGRRRREITHPHPETAIPFALLLVGWALRGAILRGETPSGSLAADDVKLAGELTRLVLAYLGVASVND